MCIRDRSNATQNLMNLDVDNSTEQEVQSDCQTALLLPQQMQNMRTPVRNSRVIANWKQPLEGKHMKAQAHYLSWYSQNEFISLCREKLLKTILSQREEAIYYGIIVDTTPDISHEEISSYCCNVLLQRFVSQDEVTN